MCQDARFLQAAIEQAQQSMEAGVQLTGTPGLPIGAALAVEDDGHPAPRTGQLANLRQQVLVDHRHQALGGPHLTVPLGLVKRNPRTGGLEGKGA